MRYYIGVIHQDEGSAWGIHFPDVPGCCSAADELDDLLPNATEALSFFFGREVLPEPRPLSALVRDPEVARDIAEGAGLLAVPFVCLSGRSKRANITADTGLLDAIDQTARERGLTRSAFLTSLAQREILGQRRSSA